LEPSPDGTHRIGGDPDLVAGETWPRNARGTALTFIDAAANHADPSLRDRDAWTLLVQFDDTFASYGDDGGFFVVIPHADLAAGRYDRAVALSQSN
jgi:hypothetical protein